MEPIRIDVSQLSVKEFKKVRAIAIEILERAEKRRLEAAQNDPDSRPDLPEVDSLDDVLIRISELEHYLSALTHLLDIKGIVSREELARSYKEIINAKIS